MAHCPAHLLKAFYQWLQHGQPAYTIVEGAYEPTSWPARDLLERISHCTDSIPGHLLDSIGIGRGTTCAALAHRLLGDMPDETQHAEATG